MEETTAHRLLAEAGFPSMDGALHAAEAREAARSENTRRGYHQGWRAFEEWCEARDLESMPADPETVANYLAWLTGEGKAMATIDRAKAAISGRWRVWCDERVARGEPAVVNPCDTTLVRDTVRGLRRLHGRPQKQAAPLTEEVLAAIRATTMMPRTGRGGATESRKHAIWRGRRDLAIVHLLADGALRVSELQPLRWRDVIMRPDGVAVIFIAHSKTDQESAGAYVTIRQSVYALLTQYRPDDAGDDEMVFPGRDGTGLSASQVSRIIKNAVRAAGIPNWNDFSSHSGRVGFAHTSRRYRAPLTAIMAHGRWKSTDVAARYGREFTDDEILQYLGREFMDAQTPFPMDDATAA